MLRHYLIHLCDGSQIHHFIPLDQHLIILKELFHLLFTQRHADLAALFFHPLCKLFLHQIFPSGAHA